MTATILTLLAHHGAVILLAMTFLSSLAVPLPASFALLAAGALTASADLSLAAVCGAALTGAVAGDLLAYGLGRGGTAALWDRLSRRPATKGMLDRARRMLQRHATLAVLASRWPFSPLAPYVNAVSGAARLPLPRFAAAVLAGNALWIGLYVGLGHAFATRIRDVGHVLSLVVWGAALAAVAALLAALARQHAAR
jgi:membrane protein DedA with SNARE-associated domain